MPKRKSSLSYESAAAKRARIARRNESSPQREHRLLENRERLLSQRERETSAERTTRLCANRERLLSQRERETSAERTNRLSVDRERHASQRQVEATSQRSERLDQDSTRHRELRVARAMGGDRIQPAAPPPVAANQIRIPWRNKENSAFHYDANVDYRNDASVSLGPMSSECRYCHALKFNHEKDGFCCQKGKVKLPEILKPPEPLCSLVSGQHPLSREFLHNIRSYNNAFQMTSFMSKPIVERGYMPTFKVQGQVYHLAGSVLPVSPGEDKFLQIYFIQDPGRQATARCNNVRYPLNVSLVTSLQNMLHIHNSYVLSFKTALEYIPPNTPDFNLIIHAEKKPIEQHARRYNAPTTSEVAVLIVGQEFERRDIVLRGRDNATKKVSETNRAYDALQYPLMLCRGEDGYSITVPQTNPITGEPHIDPVTGRPVKTVSCMHFYSYRMMARREEFNTLMRFGMLLNQYWVDQYAKIETERLNYIRCNQTRLRVEDYVHLRDALHDNEHVGDVGQMMILPSSFTAGPRYMHERTQDAMTYVRNHGRPDLFITFTCNPKWPDIRNHIFENNVPTDRYDIINRVFQLKIDKLMALITKGNIFGPIQCYMYTVEWQKRGLPHVHLLLWLFNKIRPDDIDSVISAEIPDVNADPELHASVMKHMVHGPCGPLNPTSPCMQSGGCGKKYPKSFQSSTSTGADGYPRYRRRPPDEGGFTTTVRNGAMEIDNRWVVPHNRVLLKAFDAHINVELCSSIKSIKYVCKYINKGSDQATFSMHAANEVEKFQSGRYISTSEAVWRILSFEIHDRDPTVTRLAVHLENGQRVYFTETNATNVVNNPKDTTLTAFFKLCVQDSFAKTLTYNEVPSYYTWDNKMFHRRKRGVPVEGQPGVLKCGALGRVYTVHPNNAECYYLRMLLHVVKGPTSFADLRTVNGLTHASFQLACKALGLLEDDTHWSDTLSEAALRCSASSLRHLFAIILVFCHASDPLALWIAHRENMSDDVLHRIRRERSDDSINFSDDVFDLTLGELNNTVKSLAGKTLEDFGLPLPNLNNSASNDVDILRETSYDRSSMRQIVADNENKLNTEQLIVYNSIISSVRGPVGKVFFLDAPGGTGKTFLINLLLAKLRSDGHIALAVASSGIAATLLEGGRTAHATFKLPLNISNDSPAVCNVSKQSGTGNLLKSCGTRVRCRTKCRLKP